MSGWNNNGNRVHDCGNNNKAKPGDSDPDEDKPLLLRQQRDKPILKYRTQATGVTPGKYGSTPNGITGTNGPGKGPAVPLFSQSDIHYLQQQLAAFSAPYNAATAINGMNGAYMGSLAHKYQFPLSISFQQESSPTGNAEGRGQMHSPLSQVGKVPSKNPYANPVSAKDIVVPEQTVPLGILKDIGTSMVSATRSQSGSSNSSAHNSEMCSAGAHNGHSPVIQTNAFMRPTSAFRVDQKPSPSSSRTSLNSDGGARRTTYSPKPMKKTNDANAQNSSPVPGSPSAADPHPPAVSKVTLARSNSIAGTNAASGRQTKVLVKNLSTGNFDVCGQVTKANCGTNIAVTSAASTTSTDQLRRPAYTQETSNNSPQSRTTFTVGSSPHNSSAAVRHTNGAIVVRHMNSSASSRAGHQVVNNTNHTQIITNIPSSARDIPHNVARGPATSHFQSDSPDIDDLALAHDKARSGARVTNVFPGGGSKSSLPRPGSIKSRAGSDISSSSSVSQTPKIHGSPKGNVRNPGYTPSKPYSEVKNMSPVGLCKDHTPQSPSIPRDKDERDTKSPTTYYHKASKNEGMLPSAKRPVVIGGSTSVTKPKQNLKPANGSALDEEEDGEWEDDTDTEDFDEDDDNVSTSERLPGDGEDYHYNDGADDDDIDDDDMLSDLECDESDDNSDGYSCSSSVASRHTSSVRVCSATKRLLGLSIKDKPPSGARPKTRSRPSTGRTRPSSSISTLSLDSDVQAALTPSLFSKVPPTINFVGDGEKVEQLPWEIRKLFKWRMSPITPNVVKHCIARSHFRITKKSYDWLGYWGKHTKAHVFKHIREYQKVNHFPGSFQIGRKDRLWRNLSRMNATYGKKEFSFFPHTYVLPCELKQLKRVWEEGGNKQKWIIKPPASARGIGIKVIHKWNQVPKKRAVIVQRYLSRPFLINESKFDLRVYVYVSSYDPLRIYVYDDGLVRFASCKYSYTMKSLSNKYMHLTNYSINKKNAEYESNADHSACQGHKWSMKSLWQYFKKRGIDSSKVWQNMIDLIIKTVICADSYVNSNVKTNCRRRAVCHELFGFDIMLDENLKPWIIEVNISPSLHSNSPLDISIKGGMIKDLFNIAGFQVPDKNDVVPIQGAQTESSKYSKPNRVSIDKRLYSTQMSSDERSKHAYYCQRHQDQAILPTILDILTPDDLRILVETVDEDSRRGSFQRVFPSNSSNKYLRFFEAPRYYNLLLDVWVQKYFRLEARGVALLESYCQSGIHLETNNSDPRHQWVPPNLNSRERVISAPANGTRAGSSQMLPKIKKKLGCSSKLSTSSSSFGSSSSRPSTNRSTGTEDRS